MPSQVTEFPKRHRGRPPKYDWDRLGDGQTWVCHRGQDFDTSAVSFRALVHRTATSRGKKVETRINKNDQSVTFRFYEAP